MKRHDTESTETPGEHLPWMRANVAGDVCHLRVPGRILCDRVMTSYRVALASHNALTQRGTKMVAALAEPDADLKQIDAELEQVSAALEGTLAAQYGALGFALLQCWRDPVWELEARTAWLVSLDARRASQRGESAEVDQAVLDQIAAARALQGEHNIDLSQAFGLLVFDELEAEGWTSATVEAVATACIRQIAKNVQPFGSTELETVVTFCKARADGSS